MSAEEETTRRPLAVLRAMIDTIDRDVLTLLGRRMGLVAEVAEFKREHGIAVRDARRERELLDERRGHAERLGLAPDIIESVYRLLLMASRDRQSELKAQVPLDQLPRTVAVIGGRGGMGSVMARLFGDLGHPVMVSDVDTDLRPAEAAALADVVVISVPIAVTEQVIAEVGPHVRADALLMDVTSTKQGPMRAMLAATGASVVGTHPMFGPDIHTLQGQRVVVCPGRGHEWEIWLRSQLTARGLVVTSANAERHDHAMAVVQVLTHFRTQVVGLSLARLGLPIEESLRFTSPVYLIELLMTGRHFGQSPDLYGAIEMQNPRRVEVTEVFNQAAQEVAEAIREGDQERFRELFEEAHRYFGEFTVAAGEQSSFLIDRLVERS